MFLCGFCTFGEVHFWWNTFLVKYLVMSGHAIVFLRQGGSYPDKDQGPACMINVQRPEYKTKQGGAKRKQDRNKKNLTAFWHLRLLQQLLLFNRPWQQRGPWTGINPETVSNFHVMWGQQHGWSQCTLSILFYLKHFIISIIYILQILFHHVE